MRNQDEGPYIVIERDTGGGIGSFVLGALIGAGLALLFAPKTGAETQEELKERARKLRSSAEDRMREAQRQFEDRFDDVREGVQTRFDDIKEAVTAGRSAAADARVDLERKLQRSKAAYRAGVQAARETISSGEADGDEAKAD